MSRGRRPLAEPTECKRIYIPQNITAKVDLLFSDPTSGKPEYGAWGKYITKLIRDDLAKGKDAELFKLVRART